jgi:hypothetical protein
MSETPSGALQLVIGRIFKTSTDDKLWNKRASLLL